jgi:hypothetical protein
MLSALEVAVGSFDYAFDEAEKARIEAEKKAAALAAEKARVGEEERAKTVELAAEAEATAAIEKINMEGQEQLTGSEISDIKNN